MKNCADCGGALEEIELLDATHTGRWAGRDPDGAQHKIASYARRGSRRHWFHGRRPVAGKVVGLMCKDCHRIFFYGEPR